MEEKIIVQFRMGVHSRPAAVLVQKAREFQETSIKLLKDGVEADAKSLLSILSLGITAGDEIIIKIEGENEEETLKSIISLIKERKE